MEITVERFINATTEADFLSLVIDAFEYNNEHRLVSDVKFMSTDKCAAGIVLKILKLPQVSLLDIELRIQFHKISSASILINHLGLRYGFEGEEILGTTANYGTQKHINILKRILEGINHG